MSCSILAKAQVALLISATILVAPLFATASEMPPRSILVAQGQGGQGQNQGGNQNQNNNQNENQNQNRNAGQDEQAHSRMMTRDEAAAGEPLYACFFDDAQLSGEAFCIGRQASFSELSSRWNDRISSIEIVGNFSVKLCAEAAFGGTCAVYSDTAKVLPAELDNTISSLSAQ